MIGQVLGHFRLLEQIGAGGMGIVFRARDLRLERDVAVKVLNSRNLSDPSGRKRFRREALVLSRLNHPNVELVYEFPSDQGFDYIVMEFVPGASLDDRLIQGPIPENEVIELGVQLARGLAAAHARGIIHRDLKPGNLRVTPENVLKILDFGLAQLFAMPDDETVTATVCSDGMFAGTPPYMAPEQFKGKQPDTRSDVYSAGVVLYEMATGSRPFTERGALLHEAILTSQPAAPRQRKPDLSPKLEAVILKCLEKDPNARYQSASDLLAELSRVAADQNVAIHSETRSPLTPATRRKVWGSLTAAVVVIAIAAAVFLWRPPKAEAHQKIMAVLPFDAIGQSSATSALGAGLMETVATKLVEVGHDDTVQVVSPHELSEKGVKSAADARREFGTDMVLEGSLQQSGEELRITCNLVDSKTGRQIGARTITRDVNDIFSLQDETVNAALGMLADARIKIQPASPANTHPDTQPAAYEAYIRGRGYLEEYEKPENIESAIADFDQALKIDPNYGSAHAGLGQSYWMEYQRLDKGSEWVGKASASCERALSLNPQLVEAHICLGTVLNGTGKYEKAVAEFKRATALNPQSDEALRGLADAYNNLENFSAAEETYKKAIALRPNYWGAYSQLGLFYYGQARYSDATAMFLKVTQLAPDNYRGYLTLGGAYVTQGRYQEALQAFQRSIDLRPDADAYTNLGYTYFLMHRFPEAITAHEHALKLDEGNSEFWGNLGNALYWSLGRRRESAADYRRAANVATTRLQVNPRDAEMQAYLANYSAMVDDRQPALDHLARALELAPADGEVLFRAALVYNHFGDTERTLTYLKKAASAGYSRAIIKDTPDFGGLQGNSKFISLTATKS
jgi:tetratricopeptide (TPR) repeat protein